MWFIFPIQQPILWSQIWSNVWFHQVSSLKTMISWRLRWCPKDLAAKGADFMEFFSKFCAQLVWENGGFFSNEMGRWPLKKQHIQGVGADVWTNNPTGRVIDHPSPPRQTAAHVSPSKMTYKRTGSEKSNMRCHTSNAWKPRASSQWQKDPSPSSRLTMTSLTMHSSNQSATSAVIFRKRRLDSLPASSLAQTSLNILMYQQLKCLSSALLKDRRCLFLF